MSIADKLTTIAENEQKVYDAGAKSEYDRFWDALQANGNRRFYRNAFSNKDYYGTHVWGSWDETTLLPKYPIRGGEGYPIFSNVWIDNFKEHCEKNNITFDFSADTAMGNCFNSLYTRYIPDIDVPKATTLSSMFYGCSRLIESPDILNAYNVTNCASMYYNCSVLVKIPRLWANDNANLASNMFWNCKKLEEISIIEGQIGSSVSFSSSPLLTYETIMRIIDHLRDYAAEGSTTTYTLTLGTTNLAKLTDEEKAIATQKGWTLA